MTNEQLKSVFVILNYTLGILITIISLRLLTKKGFLAPIYITAAIITVGPIENLLMKIVKPEDRWIVDQITSIVFYISVVCSP